MTSERHILPTLISDEDEEFCPEDVIQAALSLNQYDTLRWLGYTITDAWENKVPGLDPVGIIEEVWENVLDESEFARMRCVLDELRTGWPYRGHLPASDPLQTTDEFTGIDFYCRRQTCNQIEARIPCPRSRSLAEFETGWRTHA
jgi:hypothetical protein